MNRKTIKIFRFGFMIVFFVIIVKFLIVTNYYSEGYTELASYQTNVIIENPLPRGEIFDVKDRLVVGNKQKKNLVYMSSPDMDNEREWEIAQDLASTFDIEKMTYDFKEVDYQDIVISENYNEIYDKSESDILAEQERIETSGKEGEEVDVDSIMRSKVTKEDYNNLKNEYGEDAIKIKILMNNSSTSSPKVLFEDINVDEEYYILTNQKKLGGCFVLNSWERYYPYGGTLRTLLGTVGDIPEEDLEKYESLGYSTSDKVGVSYIEEEQEQYLKSTSEQIQIFFDDEGNISNYNVIDPGEAGKDLKLTIDIELQKKVEKILKANLDGNDYQYYHTDYASIMDVNTGDILVMAGQYQDGDIEYDNSIGNFSNAYEIGSVIKPVILLTGYQQGVWEYGQIVNDKPMNLGGGTVKGSYHDYGLIDENAAIGKSSNVYFYTMALKIAGIEFGVDPLPQDIDEKYFNILRNNFSKFGLGSKTGIDFKEEIEGVKANDRGVGLYMDMANGQYDTYTPLAITQYMATLANGTARYKANYLYSINEPGEVGKLGEEIIRTQSEVLNYLDYDPEDIKHVQQTLINPSEMRGGTTTYIADSRYRFASKSGTSESYYYEEGMNKAVKTDNTSFMAYAPYENPKISISVIMPYFAKDGELNGLEDATAVGGQILDAAYEEGYI